MTDYPVLDGHTHCGFTVPFGEFSSEWKRAGIVGEGRLDFPTPLCHHESYA